MNQSIGVFDSGYGGLTVLKEFVHLLPQYHYKYLGDNMRAPYGTRSFETVYAYTLQCIEWFFKNDCPLVILACNTASAKALRSIQQQNLPSLGNNKRVLGVIRPTSEVIGNFSGSGHVGLFATNGTVESNSYALEIAKFFPDITLSQEACPMWVPLIENNEHMEAGADYFVKKHIARILEKDRDIDTILLACTHYPLLMEKLIEFLPDKIRVVSQGKIVADSLKDYLERHQEFSEILSVKGGCEFYTTGETDDFNEKASLFYGKPVISGHVSLV